MVREGVDGNIGTVADRNSQLVLLRTERDPGEHRIAAYAVVPMHAGNRRQNVAQTARTDANSGRNRPGTGTLASLSIAFLVPKTLTRSASSRPDLAFDKATSWPIQGAHPPSRAGLSVPLGERSARDRSTIE